MKGYTLIEILIVLTIMAIIFSFGYVSFRDYSRRQALESVAEQVKGDLRLAQAMASAGEKTDDCTSALSGYNFNVIDSDTYRLRPSCTGGIFVKEVNLPSDFSISTPSPNPIRFKVLGEGTNIASPGNATITLTQLSTSATATITVSYVGEIK